MDTLQGPKLSTTVGCARRRFLVLRSSRRNQSQGDKLFHSRSEGWCGVLPVRRVVVSGMLIWEKLRTGVKSRNFSGRRMSLFLTSWMRQQSGGRLHRIHSHPGSLGSQYIVNNRVVNSIPVFHITIPRGPQRRTQQRCSNFHGADVRQPTIAFVQDLHTSVCQSEVASDGKKYAARAARAFRSQVTVSASNLLRSCTI